MKSSAKIYLRVLGRSLGSLDIYSRKRKGLIGLLINLHYAWFLRLFIFYCNFIIYFIVFSTNDLN